MAVQSSAGRPPFGFFFFRHSARPAFSSASSASLISAAVRLLCSQFVQLGEREATGIILHVAMDLLGERITRRVPERPLSTPSGIVPQSERGLEMLNLDRARTVQQRVDQRQIAGCALQRAR